MNEEIVENYVTVVIEFENELVEYHTLLPQLAVMMLLDLPFIETPPRPVRARIVWGSVLDTYSY